jgi:helicase
MYNEIPEEKMLDLKQSFIQTFKFEPRLRQLQAIYTFKMDCSVLACLVTSYGKTSIAIEACLKAKQEGKIVLMSVPMKALGAEHVETFGKYGLNVGRFDGDTDFDLEKIELQDVNIFTYEKLDSILRKKKYLYILDNVKYVIIDEIHTIVGNRGYAIESTIMKVKILKPNIKFIGLSATITDEEILAKFIGAKIIKTEPSERPVPLKITIENVEKEQAPFRLLEQLKDGMNTLVFASSRKRTQDLAYLEHGENAPLDTLIEHGIAYHHAGINEEDTENGEIINNKIKVEKAYREGKVNILNATTTLAAGVNLPAKRVIIFDTVRYSTLHGEVPINHAEILQMAGRSGRNPKIDKIAYCTLYVPSKYMSYFDNELVPPKICSNLDEDKHLIMFVLELVAEGICETVAQIVMKIMGNAMSKIDTKRIGEAVKFLTENKLCYVREGKINATFVGKMCVALYIDPITAIHLRDCYVPTSNLAQKFFAVLNTPEFVDNVTVREEDSQNITLVYRYLKELNVDIEMYKYKKQLCKAFCLLFRKELIRYFTEELHEQEPKIYYSAPDNMILKKSANRIFMAGKIIGNETIKKECNFLGKTISAQKFDYDMALLMQIPKIGDTRIARLLKAKITKIQDFINTPVEKLIEIIGRISEEQIGQMKKDAIQILSENAPKSQIQ